VCFPPTDASLLKLVSIRTPPGRLPVRLLYGPQAEGASGLALRRLATGGRIDSPPVLVVDLGHVLQATAGVRGPFVNVPERAAPRTRCVAFESEVANCSVFWQAVEQRGVGGKKKLTNDCCLRLIRLPPDDGEALPPSGIDCCVANENRDGDARARSCGAGCAWSV